MDYQFDLIVIGGGPGGYIPAIHAAGEGMKTAVIEKTALGGTCLNRGCIPTKTLLHTAELYREVQGAGGIGIKAKELSVSMETLMNRKDQVVSELARGIAASLKKAKVTQITGTASITGEHEVTVKSENGEEIYTAENILIATGSVPARVPIPGAELPGVLNSDDLLNTDVILEHCAAQKSRSEQSGLSDAELPFGRLIIIGGGVIGMEFASVYQALGIQVTVIEALDKLLANLDKEIGQSVKMLMKKRDVDIHTGARVLRIEQSGEGLTCTYVEKEQEVQVSADAILIAVGRRPCTDGLFREDFSVETERGRILVNENFQTSVPNIYAAGDVIGGIQLAHMASAEGLHAVAHMAGKTAPVRLDLVPSCVYTDPEIASVGLTADEGKVRGIPAKSVKYPMSANGKSLLSNQERGFVKVIYQADTYAVLGAQLMCARATDMISIFTTAIANGLTVEDMQKTMYPHPTFSEGIGEALELV